MYVQIMTVTTNKLASEKTPTPSHTLREGDGDSARSTRAFRGAELASRKPAQNGYGEDRGEELGSSSTTLRLLYNAISLPYLSLSFIVQGGRLLQPLTSSLFCVLSDKDTPQFST